MTNDLHKLVIITDGCMFWLIFLQDLIAYVDGNEQVR